MSEYQHQSVLLAEALANLNLQAGMTIVDATLGGGGHTQKILDIVGDQGMVIAFDRDEAALANAGKKFANTKNIKLVKANFTELKTKLAELEIDQIDGILFDLGVSSYQLDNRDRGFSWKQECLLDMRMDQEQTITAQDVVNQYSLQKLIKIIKEYGEERYAKSIARVICREREQQPIKTSEQLKSIILSAIKGSYQQKTDSLARVFQAIRIEVNQELVSLEKAVSETIDLLRVGGRIVVISFHSLEDRIVKRAFQLAAKGCICPPNFPKCTCGKKKSLKIITKKPLRPTADELAANVRSRSAKMRTGEKL